MTSSNQVLDDTKNEEAPITDDIKLSYERLEKIRDYIHKDIVIADIKAGLSITAVTVSLAIYAALFGKLSSIDTTLGAFVSVELIFGIVCAGVSIFCSMLTLLPRSYISYKMAKDKNCWIYKGKGTEAALTRRTLDAYHVLIENIWQKQTHGTPDSLKLLLDSKSEQKMVESLYEAMLRASLVKNMKFLWVGKALLFSFLSLSFISTSALMFLGNFDSAGKCDSSIRRLLNLDVLGIF